MKAEWKEFIEEYKSDDRFQYFPHAHIGTDRFPKTLKVLASFEGKVWSDKDVMAALKKAKLTTGGGAGGRMIRKATENLGLCWFDNHVLWMTPAGRAFLEEKNRQTIIERLLWRYQLTNPINDGAVGFDVFPHQTLLRTLLRVGGFNTRDEFILFTGRITVPKDIDWAVEKILAWRKLNLSEQDAIIASCGGQFATRQTDTSYALGFHASAHYLERFNDKRGRRGIRLVKSALPDIQRRVDETSNTKTIKFKSKSDCIAFYGDTEKQNDDLGRLDYYLDTSQYDKALSTFKALPISARGGRTVKEFESEVFLERDLENYLLRRLHLIEPALHSGRQQYSTEAGTIDIIATGADGARVVIELKKVRASDKVFGQLCRYMGCVAAKHVTKGQVVRGYIVGSEIDQKLRYAASVIPGDKVKLKRFKRDPSNKKIFIED